MKHAVVTEGCGAFVLISQFSEERRLIFAITVCCVFAPRGTSLSDDKLIIELKDEDSDEDPERMEASILV